MIRSKLFWTGAILLAIIPLLALDIPRHYLDWRRDVRDESYFVAKNSFNYSAQQKAAILQQVPKSNSELKKLMYSKGIACFLLFCAGIYLLFAYLKVEKNHTWQALAICVVLGMVTTGVKLLSWISYSGDQQIKLLEVSTGDISLDKIYRDNFKGKVVYVDFWGTTCGPCLEEFRNFTKPLKQHYQNQPGLAYLYVCSGTKLRWKQVLQKFNIEGSHVALNDKDYAMLYHRSVRGSKDTVVSMPRYLIIDRKGNVVDKDAPPPSEKDSIEMKLDKYLAAK
jgi:thiol-disulfide isomerase/thioredoxin